MPLTQRAALGALWLAFAACLLGCVAAGFGYGLDQPWLMRWGAWLTLPLTAILGVAVVVTGVGYLLISPVLLTQALWRLCARRLAPPAPRRR